MISRGNLDLKSFESHQILCSFINFVGAKKAVYHTFWEIQVYCTTYILRLEILFKLVLQGLGAGVVVQKIVAQVMEQKEEVVIV